MYYRLKYDLVVDAGVDLLRLTISGVRIDNEVLSGRIDFVELIEDTIKVDLEIGGVNGSLWQLSIEAAKINGDGVEVEKYRKIDTFPIKGIIRGSYTSYLINHNF